MQCSRVRLPSPVRRIDRRALGHRSAAAVHLRLAGRQPRRAERAVRARRREFAGAFRVVFPSAVGVGVDVQRFTSTHRKNDSSGSFQEGFLACKILRSSQV